MKRFIYKVQLILALGATISVSSCSDTIVERMISVSESSFTASSEGAEKTITVTAEAGWTAATEAAWLTVTKLSESKLQLIAEESNDMEYRSATVVITAGAGTQTITVTQLGLGNEFSIGTTAGYFAEGEISNNGHFIAGTSTTVSGETQVIRINTLTGKAAIIATLGYDELNSTITAVDNFGNIFLSDTYGWGEGLIIDKDGKKQELPLADGAKGGSVAAVSEDGSLWVGVSSLPDGGITATKWVDGDPVMLADTKAFRKEHSNGNVYEMELYMGCRALGCSNDGSVIYGSLLDGDRPVYWTAANNFEPEYVAEETFTTEWFDESDPLQGFMIEGPVIYYEKFRASSNGEYVTFGMQKPQPTGWEPTRMPAGGFFNLTTGENTVYGDEKEFITGGVLNDGTQFVYPRPAAGERQTLSPCSIIAPGSTALTSADAWVEQATGMKNMADTGILKVVQNDQDEVTAIFLGKMTDSGYSLIYMVKR